MVQRLRELLPGFGATLAVDSTDMEAYSDGYRKRPSDPDARWGAKKKGAKGEGKQQDTYLWFGYKLHLAVDAIYELPVSFLLTAANESDTKQMGALLKKAVEGTGDKPEVVVADRGYDSAVSARRRTAA